MAATPLLTGASMSDTGQLPTPSLAAIESGRDGFHGLYSANSAHFLSVLSSIFTISKPSPLLNGFLAG